MGGAVSRIIGLVDWASSTDLENANNLRQKASIHFENSKQLSLESQKSFQQGDKAQAKALSLFKQSEWKEGEDCNSRAADIIFRHFNPDGKNLSSIDLHGLYIKEAETYLVERMEQLQKENKLNQLVIITGKGNHSEDGVAVIKPHVERFAMNKGILTLITFRVKIFD